MLSPLLVIGVGGSSGKTIRSMKQALRRQLDAHGYKGGIPAAWQFLQFDTTYDGIDFPAPMLSREEVHLVVKESESFSDIKQKIERLGTNSDRHQMLGGWGIPYSPVAVSKGAGQQRTIGRQVGLADAVGILDALNNSISKMKTPTALSELSTMGQSLRSSGVDPEPKAIIIASLAGGSGAGMFIDIAEILKRAKTDSWGAEAISILYTAEVFEGLGAAGADVKKNSLGAMNEVVSGKWNTLSDRSLFTLQKLGIPSLGSPEESFFGCKGNILVGARNSSGANLAQESTGAGMDEVFLTIGEALAGSFTDSAITEFLYNQAFVNITQRSTAGDNSGLAPDIGGRGTLPFAGIGFGRLSLGIDRVVDYVADALARQQVIKLLWPELNPELLTEGTSRSSLINNQVAEVWRNFKSDSGLNENGKDDQVINALRPESYEVVSKDFVRKIVASNFVDKPKELDRVARGLFSDWESAKDEVLGSLLTETSSQAMAWRMEIQSKVVDLVAKELVSNGYHVTIALLEKLIEEVSNRGMNSLKSEYEEHEFSAKNFSGEYWMNYFRSSGSGKTGLSSSDTDMMNLAAKKFKERFDDGYNYELKKLAYDLLKDMVSGFLVPLREQLSVSRAELEREWSNEKFNGGSHPKKWLPNWGDGAVPSRYKPRTIERTLIDPTEYESIYLKYAGKDVNDSDAFVKSVGFALTGQKLDVPDTEESRRSLLIVSVPWITSVRNAQQPNETYSKATFKIDTSLSQLFKNNRAWLKEAKTSFGELTRMSIKEFISAGGDASERFKLEDKFVASYQAMISLAKPLVKRNKAAMQFVKSVSDGTPADGDLIKTSKIPFNPASEVGQRCLEVLRLAGQDTSEDGFLGKWFDETSTESLLYATSTTQTSLPAWAFESLTSPIAMQAATARNDNKMWVQFWDGRRARPLLESVPFESSITQSIITGWFVASLLGMVEKEDLPVGRTARIWNPNLEKQSWSNFPSPLLNSSIEDNKNGWVLPSILTSAGLAMVELGQSGSLEPVHGYQLLKFIGREVTASQVIGRDNWDAGGMGDELPNRSKDTCKLLKLWITEGLQPSPNSVSQLVIPDTNDTESRRAAFIKAAEKVHSEYSDAWINFENKDWEDLPHMWELKDSIALALHDIRTYVVSLSSSSSSFTSIG